MLHRWSCAANPWIRRREWVCRKVALHATVASGERQMVNGETGSGAMPSIAMLSLVVRDYDEALAFYVGGLGFELIEDSPVPEQGKRWVVVAPPGGNGARLLLARAVGEEQASRIGNQTGGRVFLFLHTDDFERDFQ